ncbi:hypothetical protein KBD75_01585 [Candidatus Woesebacteria bacterium]|nr:hypothetical protein [Candidatus Woesebacteria bacterium]
MKRIFASLIVSLGLLTSLSSPVRAESYPTAAQTGQTGIFIGTVSKMLVSQKSDEKGEFSDWFMQDACATVQNAARFNGGGCEKSPEGVAYSTGLLEFQQNAVTAMFRENSLPSSREYLADILDSVGVPTVTSAYAQGTGYGALSTFLPFWKVFRNLAYSLYIIMFVVVGIMIMLRTKVNAQTIITIQTALPNLLITLLLITFSYAIVGFMIDIMYFLIYFVVYLFSSINIIDTPVKAISRLMTYSAWGIVFEGRNSIISAAALAIGEVLSGLGTGALEVAGTLVSMVSPMYLIVAIAFAIAMLKLMLALAKSYVMIIVQTVTAPVQLLMNAMPGSKSFSTWIKTTASYLLPFPVAAVMFIFSAVMIGDPTKATILKGWTGDANPFGINQGHDFYSTGNEKIWLPPFTLTGSVDFTNDDIRVLIGFFIFLMTPSAVKMAQEWLQVKESPYASEAFSGFVGIASTPIKGGASLVSGRYQDYKSKKLYAEIGKNMQAPATGEDGKR